MLRRILFLATAVACCLAAGDSGGIDDSQALMREGARLNADEIAPLEARLQDDPQDISARTLLLGYHQRGASRREPSSTARLRSLVLWLIHNEPKSTVLSTFPSPLLEFNRYLDPEAFVEGKRAFLVHLEKEPNDLTLLKHAADFASPRDLPLAIELLERAKSVDSSNPRWGSALALEHYNAYRRSRARSGDPSVEAARKAFVEFDSVFELLDKDRIGSRLPFAAEVALVSNEIDKARRYAQVMLDSDPQNSRVHGDHVHFGNITLGKIALGEGDVQGAASYLLLAAATPGSSRLRGMGPDMTLAKELLEHGERESVLQYFDECARFWERGRDRLTQWSTVVRGGAIPNSHDFGQ